MKWQDILDLSDLAQALLTKPMMNVMSGDKKHIFLDLSWAHQTYSKLNQTYPKPYETYVTVHEYDDEWNDEQHEWF